MANWCVYKVVRTFPHYYKARLVITEVPPEENITEELLQRAGYSFESSVPWVNHGVAPFEEMFPAEMLEQVRSGSAMVECITYKELQALLRGDMFAIINQRLSRIIYEEEE